jgi:hypothetical protein
VPERKHPQWLVRLADMGMLVFGMIMMVTPLTLWVVTSKAGFYFVLELFFISAVMVWLLAGYQTTAAEHQEQQRFKRSVFDRIVARLQKMRLIKPDTHIRADVGSLTEKHRAELRKPTKPDS